MMQLYMRWLQGRVHDWKKEGLYFLDRWYREREERFGGPSLENIDVIMVHYDSI